LADAMGYRSNVLVSALMTQVRLRHQQAAPEVVGFLTAGPNEEDWKKHSSSVGFYEGARRRGQQLGLRVEAFWLGQNGEGAKQMCRLLSARAIRANLITPFPVPHYTNELDWKHFTWLALGYTYKQWGLHRAVSHHFRSCFIACENLLRLGYKRIGLMLDHDENTRVDYSWLGGFLVAQRVLKIGELAPLFVGNTEDIRTVRRWLDRQRPDAVIAFGPRQLAALKAAGRAIPDEIAFAALDVQQTSLAMFDQVAGIDQNLPAIGATAIEALASQLYHNEQGLPHNPVLNMIEGFWVEGKTAPPVKK